MKTLRTVVAAHNLNSPEGAPRYLSEIVLGLQDRGIIEPILLSPLGGAGEAVYHSNRIPVSILQSPGAVHFIDMQWSPRTYEAMQKRLMHELQTAKPDVVLANTLLMFPVVEAAARLGIPSAWILHESYSSDVLARLVSPFTRYKIETAFSLATRIIPASHDTAKLFQHLDVRHNIRVLHNGIDPAPIDAFCRRNTPANCQTRLKLDPAKTHIVAVGTVCERKGQHTLVEAAAILAKTRRDFICHLVGVRDAVTYANYIRQLVKRRGVSDVVNLVPETDDAFSWFRAADVFACTSHMETFSRSILEAEIFGLPIVSTPCQGVSEQVVWNRNALRFGIDDASTLAGRLETLIADSRIRHVMGRSSRAVFDSHAGYDTMLDRYQAVLHQITGTHATAMKPLSLRAAA